LNLTVLYGAIHDNNYSIKLWGLTKLGGPQNTEELLQSQRLIQLVSVGDNHYVRTPKSSLTEPIRQALLGAL